MTIAIDFDGVIHWYRDGWRDGTIYDEPVPGAFAALELLMEHDPVFVHSTRQPADVGRWINRRSGIETAWFDKLDDTPEFWNQIGTLLVTRVKLPAVAYIDDRGVHFTSWDETLRTLADVPGWSGGPQ